MTEDCRLLRRKEACRSYTWRLDAHYYELRIESLHEDLERHLLLPISLNLWLASQVHLERFWAHLHRRPGCSWDLLSCFPKRTMQSRLMNPSQRLNAWYQSRPFSCLRYHQFGTLRWIHCWHRWSCYKCLPFLDRCYIEHTLLRGS